MTDDVSGYQSFHFEPSSNCDCKFCGRQCEKYHIVKCELRKMSLRIDSVLKKLYA